MRQPRGGSSLEAYGASRPPCLSRAATWDKLPSMRLTLALCSVSYSAVLLIGGCGSDPSGRGETDGTSTDSTSEGSTMSTTDPSSTTDVTATISTSGDSTTEQPTSDATTDTTSGTSATDSGSTESTGTTGEDTESTGEAFDPLDPDGDGIPDPFDPFPLDPTQPGQAPLGQIYGHSSTTLYRVQNQAPFAATEVGAFQFDQNPGPITDIAIDSYGVLFAVSFNHLFVCNPETAECFVQGALPPSVGGFNGLTMLPPGVIQAHRDTLIGMSTDGGWYWLTLNAEQQVVAGLIGNYGEQWDSAGDAFSMEDVGTVAAACNAGTCYTTNNSLVLVNPISGAVTQVLDEIPAMQVFGLAGYGDRFFAFDETTGIWSRTTALTSEWEAVNTDDVAWWGAGVRTHDSTE
jgi:hypothetical protein